MAVASIPESATVVATPGLLASLFEDELVILNLADGVYYGLDHVGARIWALMQHPVTLASIRDTVMSEYAVDRDQCERDLRALLGNLAAKGLVHIELA